MKLFASVVLILGFICNSTFAVAEGPVPFAAFMGTPGAQPSIPSLHDSQNDSAVVQAKPARRPPITAGGKIMMGGGIAMLTVGAMVITVTAIMHDWASGSQNAELIGGGAALAVGGGTLIVIGHGRRKAN